MMPVDIPNPFSNDIVQNPWDFEATGKPDIQSIHATAFAACMRLLMRDVRYNGQSSLLISGPSGSGKTHLITRMLSRFQMKDPPGLLCYVSLSGVLPQELWSHLRRCLVTDLIERRDASGKTALERLLDYRLPGLLANAAPPAGNSILDLVGKIFGGKRVQISTRLKHELFPQIKPNLDPEVRTALLQLFNEDAECAQFSRDWLAGKRLTDEELRKVGLPQGDVADQSREYQSREVVLSLLRLAVDPLPIVLCFDQMETFKQNLSDREGFAKLGQMVTKIRQDCSRGLFIISFFRSDLLHLLNESIGLADRARLAENVTSLSPLTWPEANQLILQRMNAVPSLKLLRQGQDEYWPLDKQRLLAIHTRLKRSCTPRDLLQACKKEWGPTDGMDGIPSQLDEYLLLKWRQRCEQTKKAASGDRLLHALNGLPWLATMLGAAYEKNDREDMHNALPDANLFLQTPKEEQIAFSACPRTSHLWQRFDRLAKAWKLIPKKLNCRRLMLICDTLLDDLPPATKTRLQALNKTAGVKSVCPSREQMVALDALHSLLTESYSGELLHDDKMISAEEVDGWARECIGAAGHELGMLRLLFDDLGLDLPTASVPAATGKPVLTRKV